MKPQEENFMKNAGIDCKYFTDAMILPNEKYLIKCINNWVLGCTWKDPEKCKECKHRKSK